MIFFDIDGTLIDHASASAAASLHLFDHFTNEIPFLREEFPTIWETALMRHFNRFCRGEISIWDQRRARIRDVFSNPALDNDEADKRYLVFIRHYESLTQPFDDAAPALAQLAGKRLGIISNGAREQQIGKLERAGLLKHFTVMVFSEDVGLGKPAPAIFLEACRLAGDDPADCIHIGDDLTCDIEASQALGLTPIWLDRSGTAQSPSARTRITSLSALNSVLESKFALCSLPCTSASSVVNRF
jgi:putative hydrolase of the HAD superfamily